MAKNKPMSNAIRRALLLIRKHPQVIQVGEVTVTEGLTEVDVLFAVNLPILWQKERKSPNGVQDQEQVRFHFSSTFPLDAPLITLRPDFNRSLPHLLPALYHGRPCPCVSEIPLDSLLHQKGFRGILNQTAVWLANAAMGTLINLTQGWEPARRDNLPHAITADGELLRGEAGRESGHSFHLFPHAVLNLKRGGKGVCGTIETDTVKFYANTIGAHLKLFRSIPELTIAQTVALVVWPGTSQNGSPFVCDSYRPDDVSTFADLLKRSEDYGLILQLRAQLEFLRRCLLNKKIDSGFHFAIVICVRRPAHLMGSESNIELLGYVANLSDLQSPDWHGKPVEAACHREQIGAPLCRKLSGTKGVEGTWTLLGAGSVGSKIAMHLTREGNPPRHVVDSGDMRAHNAVRHALVPPQKELQHFFAGHKADALCDAIEAFRQHADATNADVAGVIFDEVERRKCIPKNTIALLNTTASLRVREALAALPTNQVHARVIETTLFSDGRVAMLTAEGLDRSPNTGDLITEFYKICGASTDLQILLFGEDNQLSRVAVGDGCGSATMVMSDAKLSAHAAALAQIVSAELAQASDDRGRISIGVFGQDGLSLQWTHHAPPRFKSFRASNSTEWTVRVSETVSGMIDEEISRWSGVETGGILMGRISEASRTFHVVDLIPAPPDTERSAFLFNLGVTGVNVALKAYFDRHGQTLYCLGTWHSHLGLNTPSGLDKSTARSIAVARIAPSLLLIKGTNGFSALVADAAQIGVHK